MANINETKTYQLKPSLDRKYIIMSNLQLSILCSIMKWGPSPVVLDDLWTHVEKALQDAIVPPAGSKVQSSCPISVLAGQAYVCKGDLFGVDETKFLHWLNTQKHIYQIKSPSGSLCFILPTSQMTRSWWPMWAAACRPVMPSWALRWTSAPQSFTRYSTTWRCPSWQARYSGVAPMLVWWFTHL